MHSLCSKIYQSLQMAEKKNLGQIKFKGNMEN